MSTNKAPQKPNNRLIRLGRIFSNTWHEVRLVNRNARQNGYSQPFLEASMKSWSETVLNTLRVEVICPSRRFSPEPMLFVGNHLSYLDIPVLLSQSPVAFVAKKQIGTWPIFGDACRTIGVVLVDRQSKDSREKTSGQIADAVRNRRQSVAVFPSGTTCLDETKPWRWGVFKIAKDYGIPLRPFRLKYTPRESTAFVGDSYFVPHLWTLLDEPKITATIEFHDPVMVYEPEAEANKWWAWTRGFN